MDKIKYFRQKDINGSSKLDFRQIVKSVVWSIALCIILLIFSALILTYTNISLSSVNIISNIIFYAGTLLCGLLSSSKIKSNGWLHGLVAGGIYTCLICLVGFISVTSNGGFSFSIIKILFSLILGSMGGIVGVNIRLDKNKRR